MAPKPRVTVEGEVHKGKVLQSNGTSGYILKAVRIRVLLLVNNQRRCDKDKKADAVLSDVLLLFVGTSRPGVQPLY